MSKKRKRILGIIGTLFIGAIGNGLWEYILNPLFSFSSEIVFNLITFGVESFKDKVYLEIAKNMHEGISLYIFTIITAILLGLIVVMLILRFRKKSKNKKKTPSKGERRFRMFAIFYLIFMVAFLQGDLMRVKYINNSITRYNQLLTIIKPYIKEANINQINSSFALIKSKSNYDTIIKKLIQIAENSKIDVTSFK